MLSVIGAECLFLIVFFIMLMIVTVSHSVLWLFRTVPLVGLRGLIVAFPGQRHLLFKRYSAFCQIPVYVVQKDNINT